MYGRDLKDTLVRFDNKKKAEAIETAVRVVFVLVMIFAAYALGVYMGARKQATKAATVAAAEKFDGLTAKHRREIVSRWGE